MVHPSRWPRVLAVMSLAVLSLCATARPQSFSSPINVAGANNPATNQDFSFTPQVAVDSKGTIFVVWEDDTATVNNILCSRSTDNGKTFFPPVNISQSTGGPFNPHMAIDSQGNINVVYVDNAPGNEDIFFSRSADGGQSFSKPLNLSNDKPDSTTPEVAVDANGNIHVVWANRDITFGIFYTRSTDGVHFSPVAVLATNATGAFAPQLALDPSGNVYVVWDAFVSSQLDLFFDVSKDNGGTFATPQNISNNAGNSITPQLALDSTGNIDVVWADNTPGTYNVFFSRSADQGTTFSSPQNVSNSSGTAGEPRVGVDSNANLSIVWQDTAPPSTTHDVWAVRSNNGTTFSSPQNLSKGTGNSVNASLTVDPSGNVDVSWEDSVTSNSQIYFTQSVDSGATFAAPQNVSNDSGFAENVQMSSDSQGNLNVVWDDDASGVNQIYFSRYTNPKSANTPPVANAGQDQTLTATGPTTPVTLDGSKSTDPDRDALTFSWSQNGAVVASGATPLLNLNVGTYTFTLTVTDTAGLTSTATTQVTVNNAPPVVNPGADQTLTATGPTTSVTLNGSGSDVDGGTLTYSWTQNGTVVGSTPSLKLNLSVGTYTFALTVTDGNATSSATTHVAVNNATPVVSAGADQTLTATGATTSVTLNGSASDVDGGTLTYSWTQNGNVVGSTPSLKLNLSVGTYTFALTVTDGNATSSATTHVTVNNATPVVNAGADQTLTATGPTTSVTLNGSASDVDGGTLTYSWTQNGTVVGSTPSLKLNLAVGTYAFTLTVTDGNATSSATTHVTVNNATPVVSAGADQTLTATGPTTSVTLNGSASDVDGGTLTYSWTQNGTVVGSTPSLKLNLAVGAYAFTLTVTDGNATSSAVTHVTLNHATPVANAGADQTLTATGATTPVVLTGSGSDVDGGTLTYSWTQNGTVVGSTPSLKLSLSVGTYAFTLTVTDGNATASAVTHVTINPAVQPPVAVVSPDPSFPCTGLQGAMITLDGSASTGATSYVWTEGSTVVGKTAKVQFMASVGPHTYTLMVSNSAGSSHASTSVTVQDNTLVLSLSLSTTARRLIDNHMVLVNAKITVSDTCDASPKVKLLPIISTDPADRGRHVQADVTGVSGISCDASGHCTQSFFLRAERPENRHPLVYTVTYAATNNDGTQQPKTAVVHLNLSAR